MSAAPQVPPRMVVVDDDRLTREMVRDAARGRARVESCEHAEAALQALEREPADLVVSDLTMPGLSGVELLERVRREHPGTDFVLFTAHATVESAVRALRMGAADFLIKPIHPDELAQVLERILARRRLLAENARLRDELHTLDACRALMRCLDPGEVYAVALDVLLGAVPAERGVAVFRRTSLPGSEGLAFRGFSEAAAQRLGDALSADKPFDLDAFETVAVVGDEALPGALGNRQERRRALVVPVRGRETEAGVLLAFEGETPFDGVAIEHAKLVAGHAELALQNAERYHRAKERAFLDDVTDVYNARFLLQATEREIQRAERSGKPLTALFLDLDRFKLVNDRYGHLVGSGVLRQLSRVLQECIRQVDTLARYGGDEFTVLLVDSGLEDGMAIAERIRRTVAETLFEGGGGAPIRLTISIGVATHPLHARDRDGLLDAADKAMYRAKSRGRNACCSASELEA